MTTSLDASVDALREQYNNIAEVYDIMSIEYGPTDCTFCHFVNITSQDSVLDLGAGSGRVVAGLIAHAQDVTDSVTSDQADDDADSDSNGHTNKNSSLGPFVAVDVAENHGASLVEAMQFADSNLHISVIAGPQTRQLILQDNEQHPQPLARGEGRVYLGRAANILDPALLQHLKSKTQDGAGFSVITANSVFTHVPASARRDTLRSWAAALAPGGRLVVEFPMLDPAVSCPAQVVRKRVARTAAGELCFECLSHVQLALPSMWDWCAAQVRDLAASAGLVVARMERLNCGDQGEELGLFEDRSAVLRDQYRAHVGAFEERDLAPALGLYFQRMQEALREGCLVATNVAVVAELRRD